VVTRMTPAGRITLSDDRLIVTEAGAQGGRAERALAGPQETAAALREHFGIELEIAGQD